MINKKYYIGALFVCFGSIAVAQQSNHWPEITKIQKTWTRWWWMGNAVDSAGIKHNLESLSEAGIGGVEITPIYGVKGEEANFIDYLSPQWIRMLDYTIEIADSLDMGVDMTLGTGWPYGGPQVEEIHAAKKIVSRKKTLLKNETINQFVGDSIAKGSPMKLIGVYAYSSNDTFIDLTQKLSNGKLQWKARKQNYTLYFIYQALTGQKVKRAAPGGKGYTLDHYSRSAFEDYIKPYDAIFSSKDLHLRGIFNDSYEVYGTNFTSDFFDAFHKKRGYALQPYLNRLLEKRNDPLSNRIRSDYRETISNLVLEEFEQPWTQWANEHGFVTKLQAHGSPGNLIDIYASADIPECETFGSMPYNIPGLRREKENIREGDADPAMLKFSSSAAHISGKPLVSSETFTWLRDHFKTALSQCKPEAEDLLLNGINHIFLHGSTYSPERATWPGWKFYASVNFNENNSIWEDASGLFSYIANCQSFLQMGAPDNETLLYYPVYDNWNMYLDGKLFFQYGIHSLNEWLINTSFYQTNKKLSAHGFASDYISDDFVQQIKFEDGKLVLPGGTYKALVVPECEIMPLKTLEKLRSLQQQGAGIVFLGMPKTVPGFNAFKERETKLKNRSSQLSISTDLLEDLKEMEVKNEDMVSMGLKFIRRDIDGEKIYYIVNHTDETIQEITLNKTTDQVTIYNPLNREFGKAQITKQGDRTKLKLSMDPGSAYILKTGVDLTVPNWVYTKPLDEPFELHTKWILSFKPGGGELPKPRTLSKLVSWTDLGDDKTNVFSGTGIYNTSFKLSDTKAKYWEIDLGDLRESAKVWINDTYVGIVWALPFKFRTNLLQEGRNTLRIQVTNLPANRIKGVEERGREWKIFYEINMVNKDYKKFDATRWDYTPSGLLGPISITPLAVD